MALKISVVLTVLSGAINLVLLLYVKSASVRNEFIIDDVDHPRRLLDLHDFEYLIPQSACDIKSNAGESKKPFIVVLVHSTPSKSENRRALRETWLHSDPRVLSFFMLGKTDSESLQTKIERESELYGDIIQGNFMDSYANMTYKHTMVMKWFTTNCEGVKYLIKVDDDFFMNVPVVFDYLKKNAGNQLKSVRSECVQYCRP